MPYGILRHWHCFRLAVCIFAYLFLLDMRRFSCIRQQNLLLHDMQPVERRHTDRAATHTLASADLLSSPVPLCDFGTVCHVPSHSLGSARGAAAVNAHNTAEIVATNWNFMVNIPSCRQRRTGKEHVEEVSYWHRAPRLGLRRHNYSSLRGDRRIPAGRRAETIRCRHTTSRSKKHEDLRIVGNRHPRSPDEGGVQCIAINISHCCRTRVPLYCRAKPRLWFGVVHTCSRAHSRSSCRIWMETIVNEPHCYTYLVSLCLFPSTGGRAGLWRGSRDSSGNGCAMSLARTLGSRLSGWNALF